MASAEASVQCIHRRGVGDLYVGGHRGVSVAFYSADELAEWLVQQGIDIEDSVWDELDQLAP